MALLTAATVVYVASRPNARSLIRVTADSKGIGLSVPTFPTLTRSEQLAWLDDFRSLGITWIRFDLYWSTVQPRNASTYDWSSYDAAIANADAYGIHVDAVVDNSTPWAADRSCSTNTWCQPARTATFASYAAAIARRYGHELSAEEIWNEPNNRAFWLPTPNASFYTRMLKDSYRAIKAVDPSMTVISGGLAIEANDGANISPTTFTEDMYHDGVKGFFDALGDHPYSYPALPDFYAKWSAWSQMGQTKPSIRSIMASNGDAAKPIWITEVGAPTAGSGTVATCSSRNFDGKNFYDDQCLQAHNVTEVVKDERSTSWAGPAFWYTYQDVRGDSANVDNFSGLLTYNGVRKRSYTALRAAIAA